MLTAREIKVLDLIQQGKSNREIAEEFHCSIQRIDTFVRRIKRKTGKHTRKELKALA